MYSFGKRSKERLETLHPDLQSILKMAIKCYDFSIICGHRDEKAQNKAFAEKKSNKKYPNSKHNQDPSIAVDIAPYNNGIDWDNVEEFFFLAGIIFECAWQLDIKIRWGGRWTSLKDCPHFELVQ